MGDEFNDSLKDHRKVIRNELKDSYNRIHSIFNDAEFVSSVAERFIFPVVPNQRCGAFYWQGVDYPYAYFKSTDGHIGQHDFNNRRSNLSLLPIIIERGGILLVDSTRRGKRFPDALSKTIPLWCAVLNLAAKILFIKDEEENWAENGKLWTLPTAVGRSEHGQIECQIEKWALDLIASGYNLDSLAKLNKPLRPLFISQSSTLPALSTNYPNFYPVVCVSASRFSEGEEEWSREQGWSYVQGAGDDHEQWSHGLTPKLLWSHQSIIRAAKRDELDSLIQDLVQKSSLSLDNLSLAANDSRIRSTAIHISFAVDITIPPLNLNSKSKNIIINASKSPTLPTAGPNYDEENSVVITARTGKQGHNSFFSDLDKVFNQSSFDVSQNEIHILVSKTADSEQSEANDLGLAIALVFLAKEYDEKGGVASQVLIDKHTIRTRLLWILETQPKMNPSRGILIRVNEFLLSKRRLKS